MTPSLPAALFASPITLDADLSFLAQFALFTLFVTLLKPLLFDPLLRLFEERERRTEGAKKEARAMDAEAGELLQRYEAELERVRREAAVDRDRLRAEAARLEAQIMADARAETARILETGKERIGREVSALRAELEAMQPELAAQIASKLLDREVAR
ncbi:MAG TPA: ATP synthase F0 subunit B [Minicystis sp.]|nr:ATP synthase F0 subunit B [Minicystis sp.]